MNLRFLSGLTLVALVTAGCHHVVDFPDYTPKQSEARGELIAPTQAYDHDMQACRGHGVSEAAALNNASLGIWVYQFGSGLATVLGSFVLGVTSGSSDSGIVRSGAIVAGVLGAAATLLVGLHNYSGIDQEHDRKSADWERRVAAFK